MSEHDVLDLFSAPQDGTQHPLEPLRTWNARQPVLAVSVPEAARLLGVGPKMAWRFVTNGELKSAVLGKRRVIPLHELQTFLARKASGVARPVPSSEHGLAGRYAARPAGTLAGGAAKVIEVDEE